MVKFENLEEMVKGRIAETLVEEMLKEAGFQVYRFGYESSIQNLTQVDAHLRKTFDGRKILSMPDFIIVRNGYSRFIEVKFRSGGPTKDFTTADTLQKDWKSTLLLWVMPFHPFFQISSVSQFFDDNLMLFDLQNYGFTKDVKMVKDESIIMKGIEQVNYWYNRK